MMRHLVIPTGGARPRALANCIESHMQAAARAGDELELVIACNGSDAQEATTHALLREHQVEPRTTSLRIVGAWERERYVGELVREIAGAKGDEQLRALLVYALERSPSDGSNRNLLQLDQVGDTYLSADDDTIAWLSRAVPDVLDRALEDFEGYDATEFWFYGSRDQVVDELDRAQRAPAPLAVFDQLVDGVDVLVAQAGILGDAGMVPSSYLLTVGGASRARLLADYPTARAARYVRRSVAAPLLSSGLYFQTMWCAFAGGALLPPFLPLDRGADALFGATLRTACGSLIGHVPWCVFHDPPDERPAMLSGVGDATPSIAHLVGLIMRDWPRPRTTDAATRLRSLGAWLLKWANLPDEAFEQSLCVLRWDHLQRAIDELEGLRAQLSPHRLPRRAPHAWRVDVDAALEARRDQVGRSMAIFPGAVSLRAVLLAYGRLLEFWPDVDAAARRLRKRGVRVALDEPPF